MFTNVCLFSMFSMNLYEVCCQNCQNKIVVKGSTPNKDMGKKKPQAALFLHFIWKGTEILGVLSSSGVGKGQV
jgi:hypothetical protein